MAQKLPHITEGTVIDNIAGTVRVALDPECNTGTCSGCSGCAGSPRRIVTLVASDAAATLAAGDRVAVRRPAGATAAALQLLCIPLAVFVIVGYVCSAMAGIAEGLAALIALAASAAAYAAMRRLFPDSGRWVLLHRL